MSGEIKPSTILDLANALSGASARYQDYLIASDYSPENKAKLQQKALEMSSDALKLRVLAIEMANTGSEAAMKSIQRGTNHLEDAAKKLRTLNKAINLASEIIDFSAAVFLAVNGKPGGLVAAAKELIKAAEAVSE